MVLNKKKAFNQIILKQLKNNCFLIYKSEFAMVCINHLMRIKLKLQYDCGCLCRYPNFSHRKAKTET